MKVVLILFLFCLTTLSLLGQTVITIYPDSLKNEVNRNFTPGVFYVPKTTGAQTDFLNNNIHQNSIRTHVIESAINNSSNLNQSLAFLDNVGAVLQALSNKTDKLIFIFEKMPVWLSNSNDGSPASTPGWFVLNTKPPSDYIQWNNMVSAVTDKLVNDLGITNAYFEIWNEPDLGSWSASENEFYELFNNTYSAIKGVDTTIPVGGPATNYWANNIYYEPPYGYLNNAIADSSLIGQLIDSTVSWNKPLDFISWHNFNHTYQTYQNAVDYIGYKYLTHNQSSPELIVSEWNTPSASRDTPVQKSFLIKNQIEIAKTKIDNNLIAAWQDFNQTSNEFHNDYGLLTFGSIHKPAYNSILLSNKLRGKEVKSFSTAPVDIIQSLSNDTLNILITNYIPPAFVEAFNHTLFEGNFNIQELFDAGYITSTTNFNYLDSIYKGFISITNSTPMEIAINNAIPIYDHYDSLQFVDRSFTIKTHNYNNNYSGHYYLIDSTNNNQQFKYDSLLNEGFTQVNAIQEIVSSQSLVQKNTLLQNGNINFSLSPNAVVLFQFIISGLSSLEEEQINSSYIVFPNPTNGMLEIRGLDANGIIKVVNINGQLIEQVKNTNKIDFSGYKNGVYLLELENVQKRIKVIKE